MRKTVAVATALAITLAACSSKSSPDPRTTSPDLSARIERIRQQGLDGTTVFASFLKPVGDCDALLAHIHAEAAARVGPYGLPGYGSYGIGAMATDGRMAATGSTAAAAGSGAKAAPAAPSTQESAGDADASGTFSGTNNQESGVDEPDIVKTDGRRIVTLTANRLSVVDVSGGTAGAVRATSIGGDTFVPSELLLVGDRALVFGTAYDSDGAGPIAMPASRFAASSMPYPGGGAATVTEVDLSGTAAPKVGSTLRVDGAYLTGRLVGTTVRMVVRSEPHDLAFVTPQSKSGEERARTSNMEVVLDSKIEDWLPSYTLVGAGGNKVAEGMLTDCAHVDAPTAFAGFGSLSVLTFDATKPLTDGDAVTILAGGQTVYASDANLYVATETWIDPEQQTNSTRLADWERTYSTSVHQFSIEGSKPAAYLASGTVPGHLLNQFSLSEDKGVLRVASTKGTPWSTQEKSESLITTLQRNGDALTQLGQVGDMGRGERIYSVRYAGDVAYVVTFRQTDPFYTVDLSDPRNPKVLGELKISGYSGYLHPIADHLVIGVGQEASEQGRVQGAKVSLFDVSDLAQPKELAKWTSGAFGQTGVEWDHHAFLYWPETRTLVLPLMEARIDVRSGQPTYGAIVLKVERGGITEIGRIDHGTEAPAKLGATDCRKVTAQELAGNKAGVSIGGDQLVLICQGQSTGAIGYTCNRVPPQVVQNSAPDNTVPADGHVEICYPTWNRPNPIQRSLVIGSSLWTLSQQQLQANALDTLARTARIEL